MKSQWADPLQLRLFPDCPSYLLTSDISIYWPDYLVSAVVSTAIVNSIGQSGVCVCGALGIEPSAPYKLGKCTTISWVKFLIWVTECFCSSILNSSPELWLGLRVYLFFQLSLLFFPVWFVLVAPVDVDSSRVSSALSLHCPYVWCLCSSRKEPLCWLLGVLRYCLYSRHFSASRGGHHWLSCPLAQKKKDQSWYHRPSQWRALSFLHQQSTYSSRWLGLMNSGQGTTLWQWEDVSPCRCAFVSVLSVTHSKPCTSQNIK